MIKAILFDMDGLIFDSEKVWKKHNIEKSVTLPTPINEKIWLSWMGSKEDSVRQDLISRFPDVDKNIIINYREAVLKAVHDDFKNGNVDIKKGFDEIIQFAKENNLKTALATSSDYAMINSVFSAKGYNYKNLFDFVISGTEVKNGKPAPDIYNICLQKFSILPTEAVILEDSINGVKSGINSGCNTIMVIDIAKPTPEITQKCSYVCNNLIEAKNYIKTNLLNKWKINFKKSQKAIFTCLFCTKCVNLS